MLNKNHTFNPSEIYKASVFVNGGTADQGYEIMHALRELLFDAGCEPVDGDSRQPSPFGLDRADAGFTGFSTPDPSDSEEPNICFFEFDVNAKSGKDRVEIVKKLNALGAWLTGRSDEAPSPAMADVLQTLLTAMNHVPAATLTVGRWLFSKHRGANQFWILPLKARDQVIEIPDSVKLSNDAYMASAISRPFEVLEERITELTSLVTDPDTTSHADNVIHVRFGQDRLETPVLRPLLQTGEVLKFTPRHKGFHPSV